MDEIGDLSGPPEAAVPEPRLSSIKAHLNVCLDCQENLALYRKVEAGSARELPQDPEFILDSWAHLRREAGLIVLDLTLLPRGSEPSTSTIVEQSVQLAGALSAQGCTVSAIDLPESRLRGLRATFHPEDSPDTISVEPVCDWVDVKGELESGQTFNLRSLVCISGKPRVSSGR
jgi:hypothetical protein